MKVTIFIKNRRVQTALVFLAVFFVLGLNVFVIYRYFIEPNKDKEYEVINQEVIHENNDIEDSTKEEVNYTITEEEAIAFIRPLTSETSVDLFPVDTVDPFSKILLYLLQNSQYTKEGDLYIFRQSDVQDVARKYFMKENYEYIPTDIDVTYDSSDHTYKSGLNFGLVPLSPSHEKITSFSDFSFINGVASVTYHVKTVYDKNDIGGSDNNIFYTNYFIKIIKVNDELRIKKVTITKDEY